MDREYCNISEHITLLTALSLIWNALSCPWSIVAFLWEYFYCGYSASVRISSHFNSFFAPPSQITLDSLVSFIPLKETLNNNMLTSYIHNIRQHTYNNNKLHQTGVFWLDVPVQTPHPSILVHSKPLSCKMFKQIVSSSPVSIYDLSVLWGLSRQHRKIIKHPMRPSKKKKKKKPVELVHDIPQLLIGVRLRKFLLTGQSFAFVVSSPSPSPT